MARERRPFSPQSNNNIIPPESGGRFHIADVSRPSKTRTPTVPREAPPPHTPDRLAPPPTNVEATAANSGAYAESTRTVERVGGNGLLRFGSVAVVGLGGLGIGAWQTYENIPAVHQTVGSKFLDHFRGKDIQKLPETFDNTKDNGVVSPKNILFVPIEIYDKTPLYDEKGNPILDFPWDPNNPVEMRYEKSFTRPLGWDGTGLDPNTEVKNRFEGKTILPAGYEFRTLYPGRVFFMGSTYNEEASQKSPSNPYGLAVYDGPPNMAKVEFMAPNGVLYFINIGIHSYSSEGLRLLEPLIEAPFINPENKNARDWEKGALVKRGQAIFRTTKKGYLAMSIEGGKDGTLDDVSGRIPGNFQFHSGENPSGLQKFFVSELRTK